jgi:hypothetical protein
MGRDIAYGVAVLSCLLAFACLTGMRFAGTPPGDQHGGDEAGRDQRHRHDQRSDGEQLTGVADPRRQPLYAVFKRKKWL